MNRDFSQAMLDYLSETLCVHTYSDFSKAIDRCVRSLWDGASASLFPQNDLFAEGDMRTAKAEALQSGCPVHRRMTTDLNREEWAFPVKNENRMAAVFCIYVPADTAEKRAEELEQVGKTLSCYLEKQFVQFNRAYPQSALTQLAMEVKVPLSAALSSVQLLTEKLRRSSHQFNQEYRPALEIAQRNIYRSLRTAGNITDAERVEAGMIQAHPVSCNAADLAEMIVDELRPIAKQRKIALELEKSEGLFLVYSDTYLTERILLSLLSNAFNSVPEGTGKIKVIVNETKDGGVVLSVRDNGRGVSEGQRPHIFEKFCPAEQSSDKHLGLGLYLAKKFAELNRAELGLTSADAGNTCFELRLPAAWPGRDELALHRPSDFSKSNVVVQLIRIEFAEYSFLLEM